MFPQLLVFVAVVCRRHLLVLGVLDEITSMRPALKNSAVVLEWFEVGCPSVALQLRSTGSAHVGTHAAFLSAAFSQDLQDRGGCVRCAVMHVLMLAVLCCRG